MARILKLISEETEENTDYGVNNGLIFTPKYISCLMCISSDSIFMLLTGCVATDHVYCYK